MTRTAFNYPLLDPKKARRTTRQARIMSLMSKTRRLAQDIEAKARGLEERLQKERERSWWSVTKERANAAVKALFRRKIG